MMISELFVSALLLVTFAQALPQAAISATTSLPAATTTTSDLRDVVSTTSSAAPSRIVNIPSAPGFTGTTARTFIGWSSSYTSRSTTRYDSEYCSRSSVYVESVHDGTTYAGCCDGRYGSLSACSTTELAMYCVNNVLMAGNKTLSDCGISSKTCAHALIYQNVGDDDVLGVKPISFQQCSYYGGGGGTYYRTLPTTNATTRPFTTGYSSSSSSSGSNDDPFRSQKTGAAIAGAVFAFIICFVIVPVCILNAAKRNRNKGGTAATLKKPSAPPTITPAPPYEQVSSQGYTTLDPGRPRSSFFDWSSSGGIANAQKPTELRDLPPPRYEDVGQPRIVR